MRLLVTALVAMALLVGCDRQRVSELEEGVSTEADVRARFGAPDGIYLEANGDRTLEYSRQPAGQVNYMISIDPSGKMSSLRQVLHPGTFAKVTHGLHREEVRRMLGKPAKMQTYSLRREEVWDWRFADSHEVKIFSVTFDQSGAVIGTGVSIDPKEIGQRG